MIRINLVAGERRAAKASAGRSFQVGQKMTVVGSLLLVITLLAVGWRYWTLVQTKAQVARDIDAAKREESRLAEVLKQVADFEARKKQIEQRVALIDELRKGQNAPVHMIDQISRALPDMTWLTSMRQEGYDVTIQGRTLTLTSLSDFVGNLEASRYFKRPVEIIDSGVSTRQQNQEGPQLIEFTIKGTFQMSGIDSTPPPPPGRKAPPKRGGKNG
jgi:type IV pilus assembly protein PilN